ncbi:hypothetical protein BC936DRAFT_149922 [Jimgerdemannia flammicorona]|uniref:Xylanolytic transcriptional activator regulatory domain-containing protein n=1 Tax=Jimgerdemannia flammicorona TaxID=994334 RepID=A0A433CZV0_9FUNG|nr:hypothetical protein BC936DRAFT_149922 [Jimgerdemannia flammicorona]
MSAALLPSQRIPSPPPSPCHFCHSHRISCDRSHPQCKHFAQTQHCMTSRPSPDVCDTTRKHKNKSISATQISPDNDQRPKDGKPATTNNTKRGPRKNAAGGSSNSSSVLSMTGGYKFRVNVPRFVDRTNKSDPRHQSQQQDDADSALRKRKRNGGAALPKMFSPPSPATSSTDHQHINNRSDRSRKYDDDDDDDSDDGAAAGGRAEPPSPQWSVLTPLEYKTVLSEESSWQVTMSTDFERLFPTVVSAGVSDDTAPSRSKFRGRPQKGKQGGNDQPDSPSRSLPSPPRELEFHHNPYSTLADISLHDRRLIRQSPGSMDDPSAPWTLSHEPTGISINFHIGSASNMCTLLESLLRSISAGQLDISLASPPSSHHTATTTTFCLLINKRLFGKYRSNTYSYGCTASSCQKPQLEWSADTGAEFLYQNSSLDNDHVLRTLVDSAVDQYLACGNVFHPFVHRRTFKTWYYGLMKPLDHPLVMAIAAAWTKHTCDAHSHANANVQNYKAYFTQRAFVLFEDCFDSTTYETLCTLSILLLFAEDRHKTYHGLAARILHSLDLFADVQPAEAGDVRKRELRKQRHDEEDEQESEVRLLAVVSAKGDEYESEMRRRVWWDWFYNDDCCQLLPALRGGPATSNEEDVFGTLRLPQSLPDEEEVDVSGVRHFAAKCSLCAIRRRITRAIEHANDEGQFPAEEILRLERMLQKWRETLPDYFRLDVTGLATAAPYISIWPFYLATELEMKYQSAMLAIHRVFVQNAHSPAAPTATTAATIPLVPSPRHSLTICLDACSVIVALLHARQVYEFCRSNVHTLMEVCDTLLDVLAVTDTAYLAARTLAKALHLIEQTRAYKLKSYVSEHHNEVLDEAWKRYQIKPLEKLEEGEEDVWYKPNLVA